MPVVDKETLKGYFNNGDVPNESNYVDLIDSLGGGGGGGTAIVKHQVVFTIDDSISISTGKLQITNEFGSTATITKVSCRVPSAVSGDLTIDIHKNGTTIFTTQSNRPKILNNQNYGLSDVIDVTDWLSGEYLTLDIDGVGTATDLVVVISFTISVLKHKVIFTLTNAVLSGSGLLQICNEFGSTATISRVSCRVPSAVSGDLIIDIHKNGTTIFTTQSNRPKILDTQVYGFSTTIDVTNWAQGEYLSLDIDSVGTALNLVVIIVFIV